MDAEPPDLQELHELRRRVYGPSRDLEDDPDAHVRLAALESARASAPVMGDDPPGVHERPVRASAADTQSEPGRDPEPGPDPMPDAPSRIGRLLACLTPRATRALQVAALILALAGTAATTVWITREPGEAVAALPLRAQVEISLNQSDPSEGGTVETAEFHGLTLSKLPGNTRDQQINDDCLSVQPTDAGATSAVGAYSCGAGEVLARVPINVTDELPAELREVFPVGTTLVFDLDGDVVRVRALSG